MSVPIGNGPTDPAVVCRAVRIAYGSIVVVPGLDLAVDRAEMVVLLGPSGSGKTTILSALAGFIPVRSGEISIGGRLVSGPDRHEPPERRDVAVVFQGYALWPHLSALETVAYPIRRRGVGAADAHREAAAILDRLGIAGLASRRPHELSGGEQQRVGLGRALARQAGLYLFDEPTAHLDAELRDRLQAQIAEQRRALGAAAIYATHDTAEALALADRLVLVRDGELVQHGAPLAVYDRPVDMWAARLTGPAWSIPIHVLGSRDGRARVDLAGSIQEVALDGAAAGGSDPGGQVDAIVRPDWVRLGGDLVVRVTAVAFRGTHTDYIVTTPAGELGVRVGGPPSLAPGSTVGCTIEQAWIPSGPPERAGTGS